VNVSVKGDVRKEETEEKARIEREREKGARAAHFRC